MNFDEMLDAWKSQDDKPLQAADQDLLRLVLRNEQAGTRRALRWDQWTTYIVGGAMAAAAGASLWAFLQDRGLSPTTVAAALVSLGAVALWILALWLSRRHQAARERGFGNTVREEVRRNLSLVDYQLSQLGRWSNLMLWSAPIIVGASVISWLIFEYNEITDPWLTIGMIVFLIVSIASTTYDSSRTARQQLLPRRQRLRDLLETLDQAEV